METVDKPVRIYGLMGPDQRVRYVGRTTRTVDKRLADHRGCCKPARVAARSRWTEPRRLDPLYCWMIWTGPQLVTAQLLDVCTEAEAPSRELHWITTHATLLEDGGYNRRIPC